MKEFQLSVVEEMESRDSSIAEVFMLCPVGEHGRACTVLVRMTVPCLKRRLKDFRTVYGTHRVSLKSLDPQSINFYTHATYISPSCPKTSVLCYDSMI